jgi:flagellar biosynthesis/type III secretory pathway protein FliH
VQRAQAQAEAILQQANSERDRIVAQARQQGLQEASATVAAAWLALRHRQEQADRDAQERVIAMARILAERLLGEALRLEPATVVALARQALQSLRRARQVVIEAHPDDVPVLQDHLASLQLNAEVARVVPDASRARGCLRVVSDLGVLEADLAPQLDRLVEALRQR